MAALASQANAELVCQVSYVDPPPAEFPLNDCGLPEYGNVGAFGLSGTTYDRHKVTTSDGYELTMVRLTDTVTDGDVFGAFADAGSKGPVMLLHSAADDGYSWLKGFSLLSGSPPTLPETLFNAGYDVWIANLRGTPNSRTHTMFDADSDDPDTGAAKYWDFGVEELSKTDIPASINEILTTRQAEDSCQKVKVITHSTGGGYLTVTLNDLATSSESYIDSALNQGLCAIYNRALTVNPNLEQPEDA